LFLWSPPRNLDLAGFFEERDGAQGVSGAAAYIIIAAGGIILGSAAFPAGIIEKLDLCATNSVILLMGFPIARMLSWAFDITTTVHADGIQVTPDGATPRNRNVPSQ